MSSRRLQVVLDLDTGRYTGRLSAAGSQMRQFGGTVNSSSRAVREMGSSFDNLNNRMSTPLQKLRDYVLILGNIRLAILNVRDIAVGWVGSLLKQSAEVERLTILMRGLSDATTDTGRNKEAQDNMARLMHMARESGFAVRDLADSFVKMKSAGLDPLNGSMEGLVDAVAKFGGTGETMHRASIAIQQMAGKGVISMEELRQQLGEAVPTAMFDMARAAGMSVAKFTKLVGDGAVQAKPALQLMFNEFTRMYSGAGEQLSNTLNGQIGQFKTNLLELATSFSELSKSNAFNAETGKQEGGGLFQGAIDAMKQINEAMRTNEAKLFMADVGQAVNKVMQSLMAAGSFIARFRDEFGTALKVVAAGFLMIQARNFGAWIIANLGAGVAAARNFGAAAGSLSTQVMALTGNIGHLNTAQAAQARQAAFTAAQDMNAARAAGVQVQATRAKIASLQVERVQLVASANAERMRAAQANAAILIAQRRIQANGVSAASLRQLTIAENNASMASQRLSQANQRLSMVDGQLTAASATLTQQLRVEAGQKEIAAMSANKAAAANTFMSRASGMAAAASRLLGAAVSMALGPIGMIAMALYAAAEAAGVFRNQADEAAAAAARLMQGLADLESVKEVTKRQGSIKSEYREMADDLNAGGRMVVSEAGAFWVKYSEKDKEGIRKRLSGLKKEFETNTRAIARGNDAIAEAAISQNENHINRSYEKFKAAASTQHDLYVKQQRKLLDAKKITDEEFKKRTDTSSVQFDTKAAAYLPAVKANLEQQRAAAVAAGKSTEKLDELIYRVGETARSTAQQFGFDTDSLRAGLTAGGDAAGGAAKKLTDAEKAAKKAGTAFDNARERYKDMIANQAGEIAELQAELQGGEGALAKFQAKVALGLYDDALPEELAKLAEGFAKIDKANEDLNFKRSTNQLAKDLAKSRVEADQLWASLKGGTYDMDQRMAQMRSRFAGLTDGITDPAKLAEVNAQIDQMIANLQRADAADVAHSWEKMAEDIQTSLMDEDSARQRNFDLEVQRQRALIDWTKLLGDERVAAEQRFENWRRAAQMRMQREGETSTQKMARDWAKLGSNIDQALSGALSSFVDGMFDADFNFGKFSLGIVKQLIKIILQAMIAYAILSAIGMANNSSGKPVSMGTFMKGQIAGGFGGSVNPATSIGHPVATNHTGGMLGSGPGRAMVDPSIFAAAKSYHNGGWIGGRQLKPGEVPIVGLEGEQVLTKEQQAAVGRGATAGATNVQVNVINNSGTELDAEQGQPEFDGRDMIINVVVEAAQKQGPLRTVMEQIGRG